MLKQFLLLQSFSFVLFNVVIVGGRLIDDSFSTEENPFTPKASLVRYWNKEICHESPISEFLISKASPLNAVESATYSKLVAANSLSTLFPDFCSAANLFCFPDSGASLEKPSSDKKNTDPLAFPFSTRLPFIFYHNKENNDPLAFSIRLPFIFYHNKENNDPLNADSSANTDSVGIPFFYYYRKNTVKKCIAPGTFFRESSLKEGTVIPMPDIKDKMPKRSFLPRSITTRLPFSSSKLDEIKRIFHAGENSTMEEIITHAVTECESSPSAGETKRCVGSAEDMIDFATSVLGRSVVLRTTENVAGSKQKVVIGKVNGINGGKVTKAVSCHQFLYPYLLYYCHSVPKVRVYEADLLELDSKKKINHGIAICHMDTSSWGPSHEAFVALGSKPGRIEVCHWIFENDMIWVMADY